MLETVQKKKFLGDVVILRLILIFFLIWNHSFAPYVGEGGSWSYFEGFPDIPLYKWFAIATHYMRFQTLIFISGYLCGYTANRKSDALTFQKCVVKKMKRLLLPSIIFSVIYYILFMDLHAPVGQMIYSILNGCGHLWFLPMLFWCFVFLYFVEKFKINPFIVLTISIIGSCTSAGELPFRLTAAITYFVFFYLGFGIQREAFSFVKTSKPLTLSIVAFGVYIVGLLSLQWWVTPDIFQQEPQLILKGILYVSWKTLIFIVSLSGLLFCYWISRYYISIKGNEVGFTLIKLSTYCYGVYICQQFILQVMYYKTDAPELLGPYFLPWAGIVITLIVSLALTHYMLKTNVGRFLIG